MPEQVKIELEDGKYTVIQDENYNCYALRYGERWRDLTGDKLVMSMFDEIRELRQKVESLSKEPQS